MKIAPVYRASRKYPQVECRIVHTGQHYDREMSEAFFEDLGIPAPDHFLGAGSGSHAVQTAKIMIAFEEVCLGQRPDLVMVVGDVNSTLACSITAKKLRIDVAHIEAGLRSFDASMPEEINRIVTDSISDHLFVTEESGLTNLAREGRPKDRIHFVGNVMIDNLLFQLKRLEEDRKERFSTFRLKRENGRYAFLTLHRPSNVDDRAVFGEIAEALNTIAEERPIFFPMHPRTGKTASSFGIRFSERIILLPPLSYQESLFLWKDAEAVLTDSGGLQEETTALGVPCITIRENTERPVTVDIGTNIVAGVSKDGILAAYEQSLEKAKTASLPSMWDGKASERIWGVLCQGMPENLS